MAIDVETVQLIKELAMLTIPTAVTWGALRADVKNLMQKTTDAHAYAREAHTKIDAHINDHAKGDYECPAR